MFAGIRPLIAAAGIAFAAFRESILSARVGTGRPVLARGADDWSRWESRVVRYDIEWALYQNTALRVGLHAWSRSWKAAHGVQKGARHVFSPCHELGEFWVDHIWGGALDPAVGDGSATASAIPIDTKLARVRLAIALIWMASNWQVNKDICTRYGAVLGDVFLRVEDDPEKGEVRIEVIHPGEVYSVTPDHRGNVKGYEIRRWVDDPDGGPQQVLYREIVGRDGDLVTYRTLKNDRPYAWNGVASEWAEPYGFVPMVHLQHRNLGLGYGVNAWRSAESRFLEADDQASSLGDAIRRAHKAPMFIAGMDGPPILETPSDGGVGEGARGRRGPGLASAADQAARQQLPYIWCGDAEAKAYPLSPQPDAIGSDGHIRLILERIDRAYPELIADAGIGGGITAEAVRNARQKVTDKAQGIRTGYDDALVRVLQMAIAIAGFRGYEGFEGYGLDSFRAGHLAFSIAHRDVFKADPRDDLEDSAAFWAAAGAAVDAGCPLPVFLRLAGWDEGDIAEVQAAIDAKARADAAAAAATPAPSGQAAGDAA